MSKVALIPARAGSKRIVNKNIRELAGHPLLAYAISSALESNAFGKVLVSSDSAHILEIASHYGADVLKRPEEFATDVSPDIGWVTHALDVLTLQGDDYDTFSILRPTSPFRKADTIRRAFELWDSANGITRAYSSLRAVEPAGQHPGKMWTIRGEYELAPILIQPPHPWHDSQYAALPSVYVQNASLEIAWVNTVLKAGSISGQRVVAFRTFEDEGVDINSEYDWTIAEARLGDKTATLPRVYVKPWEEAA